MKTFIKSIFALILSAVILISCQKETVYPQTNQTLFYVYDDSAASSVIDTITIDGLPVNASSINPFPYSAGSFAILSTNIPAGEKESVVKVYLHGEKGETIVFDDSYGVLTATTFTDNVEYVSTNLKVGFGIQAPAIHIYKVVPDSVKALIQ